MPCIYYGDEAGLEGYSDPFNRRTYPWGRENRELIEWYKKIIRIRHEIDALATGDFIPLHHEGDIYGFAREINNKKDVFGSRSSNCFVLVFLNRSSRDAQTVSTDLSKWNIDSLYDVLNNKTSGLLKGTLNLELKPLEGRILTIKPNYSLI
jgi:4-alpha-glucanotransferase